MSVLEDLNPEQRQAVEAPDSPLVIVAGPGTGKTKTLSARIVHLIQTGRAKPEKVVALTFTRKAAREMQERVATQLESSKTPLITTFHGLAHQTIASEGKERTLVSDTERVAILRHIKKTHGLKQYGVRDMGLLVSRAKNHTQPPYDPAIRLLLETYNSELAARKVYDFDDLLLEFHAFLQQHKLAYRHVLVDEFQDTNALQYDILRLLNITDNIFVIGDPLQSIYGFRGAHAGVFSQFETDWPQATRITLSTNYRSAPQIVRVAGAIFPDPLPLQAHRSEAGKVEAGEVLNEYGEAEWVLQTIEQQIGGSDMLRSSKHHTGDSQRTFKDFAVLYRTHSAAKTIERTLEHSGIPYQVAGEGSPYLQPHIAAVVDAMTYVADRGAVPTVAGFTPTQLTILLDPLKQTTAGDSPKQLAEKLIDTLGLRTDKHAKSLRQFTNALVRFDGSSVAAYIQHVQELAEQEYYDPSADAVTLLTIHAAKGLEFSRVFLIAAEEGMLPLKRPGGEPADSSEERRLFYVAVTRAQDELYMLHAKNRGGEPARLSSFISELPKGDVTHVSDPAMAAQVRKIQKRDQKRAQGTLF